MSSRNLIHLVICVGVIQSSSYVLLLAIGYRTHRVAPVFADIPASTPAVDPVVQALMLTDIVVEVTVVALLLGLAVQIHKRHGTLNPDRLQEISG
jgi:multicomponent Na+:H+ antiporter subunit C